MQHQLLTVFVNQKDAASVRIDRLETVLQHSLDDLLNPNGFSEQSGHALQTLHALAGSLALPDGFAANLKPAELAVFRAQPHVGSERALGFESSRQRARRLRRLTTVFVPAPIEPRDARASAVSRLDMVRHSI